MLSRVFVSLVIALVLATPAFAAWGSPDAVPGATVIVPFFEVGIEPTTHPQDTLPVVYNTDEASIILHWEVYTIDGARVFSGNQTVFANGSWSFSMRSHLDLFASVAERALLEDDRFYRGFMTIDAVTEETDLSPFQDNYPFQEANRLLGYAYYARLLQGSANGLALPSLEHVTTNLGSFSGFYTSSDQRETFDMRSRACAGAELSGIGCEFVTFLYTPRIRSRVFQSNAINGATRIVVFAWNTSRPDEGGPSAICDSLGTCPSTFLARRYRENGVIADERMIRLDHVVNIIETANGDVAPGQHAIEFDPQPGLSILDPQFFAFSFNSASPANNPNTNWDAIFVSSVMPF